MSYLSPLPKLLLAAAAVVALVVLFSFILANTDEPQQTRQQQVRATLLLAYQQAEMLHQQQGSYVSPAAVKAQIGKGAPSIGPVYLARTPAEASRPGAVYIVAAEKNRLSLAAQLNAESIIWFEKKDEGPLVWQQSSQAVVAPARASAISSGQYFHCALIISNRIYCWGYNKDGQLGDGTTEGRLTPVMVANTPRANAIATGLSHSCAVLASGRVRCWGANNYGQLGNGRVWHDHRASKSDVKGISSAISVATGGNATCAIATAGAVYCWGENSTGQLADGTRLDQPRPRKVIGLKQATQISVGAHHACALLVSKRISCWGSNDRGQLGNGSISASGLPQEVTGISNAIEVKVGRYHSCALLSGGTIKCWGTNTYGQLGDGSYRDRLSPVLVKTIDDARAITAGAYHSCANSQTGRAQCWGLDDYGQLGSGPTQARLGSSALPIRAKLKNVVSLSASFANGCALSSSGAVRCWGAATLGDGSLRSSFVPVAVSDLS